MTLPLPRSVGVQSECELFCVLVNESQQIDAEAMVDLLQNNMPDGMTIKSIRLMKEKSKFEACRADYTFKVKDSFVDTLSKAVQRVSEILESNQPVVITRRNFKTGKSKPMDLRGYLLSIEQVGDEVRLATQVSQQGAVRVEEWMDFLELTQDSLTEPVRRSFIEWKQN